MIHFWLLKRNLNFLRMTAVLLAVSFLFTTLSAPFVQASFWEERRKSVEGLKKVKDPLQLAFNVGLQGMESGVPENMQSLSKSFGTLSLTHLKYSKKYLAHNKGPFASIPKEFVSRLEPYGEIEKVYLTPGQELGTDPNLHPGRDWGLSPKLPLVILVQDAHGIYSAQRNIAQMLQQFTDLGVKLVGVEGSVGKMAGIEKWRRYPDRESLLQVAGWLMEQGLLTGVEVAGLSADGVEYAGVEQKEKYLEQIRTFTESLKKTKELELWKKEFEKKLASEKEKIYPSELIEFDRYKNAYENGDKKLGEWIEYLETKGPSLKDFPNLFQYLQVYGLENKIDFKSVEAEQKKLLIQLSKKLNKKGLSELLEESLAYRLGNIGSAEFYALLRNLCLQFHIPINLDMNRYVKYVVGVEEIEKDKLFQELKELEDQNLEFLVSKSKDSRVTHLVQSDKDYRLARKAFDFTLTPEEWKEFSNRKTFVFPSNAAVQSVLKNVNRFNQLSQERNQIFVQKLLEKNANISVLVAGGYHRCGVEELLKKKNISYITLRPRMEAKEAGVGYHPLNAFKKENLPLEKMFLPEKVSLAPPHALETTPLLNSGRKLSQIVGRSFRIVTTAESFSKNNRKGVEAFTHVKVEGEQNEQGIYSVKIKEGNRRYRYYKTLKENNRFLLSVLEKNKKTNEDKVVDFKDGQVRVLALENQNIFERMATALVSQTIIFVAPIFLFGLISIGLTSFFYPAQAADFIQHADKWTDLLTQFNWTDIFTLIPIVGATSGLGVVGLGREEDNSKITAPSLKPADWYGYSLVFTKEFYEDAPKPEYLRHMLERLRNGLSNPKELLLPFSMRRKWKGELKGKLRNSYRIPSGNYRLYFSLDFESKVVKFLAFKLKGDTIQGNSSISNDFLEGLSGLDSDPKKLLQDHAKLEELNTLFQTNEQSQVSDNLDRLFLMANTEANSFGFLQGQVFAPLQRAGSLKEISSLCEQQSANPQISLLSLLMDLTYEAQNQQKSLKNLVEGVINQNSAQKQKVVQLVERLDQEWQKTLTHVKNLVEVEYYGPKPSIELLQPVYAWFLNLGDKIIESAFEVSLEHWVSLNLFFGKRELSIYLLKQFELEENQANEDASYILERLLNASDSEARVKFLSSYFAVRRNFQTSESDLLIESMEVLVKLRGALLALDHVKKLFEVNLTDAQEILDEILSDLALTQNTAEIMRFSKLIPQLSQDLGIEKVDLEDIISKALLFIRLGNAEEDDMKLSLARYIREIKNLSDGRSIEIAIRMVDSIKNSLSQENALQTSIRENQRVESEGRKSVRVALQIIPEVNEIVAVFSQASSPASILVDLNSIAHRYIQSAIASQPEFLSALDELEGIESKDIKWVVEQLKQPNPVSPFLVIALEVYFSSDPAQIARVLKVKPAQYKSWAANISSQHPGLEQWFRDRKIAIEKESKKKQEREALKRTEESRAKRALTAQLRLEAKKQVVSVPEVPVPPLPQVKPDQDDDSRLSYRFKRILDPAISYMIESDEGVSRFISENYPNVKNPYVVRLYPEPDLQLLSGYLSDVNFNLADFGIFEDPLTTEKLNRFLLESWFPTLEKLFVKAIEKKYGEGSVILDSSGVLVFRLPANPGLNIVYAKPSLEDIFLMYGPYDRYEAVGHMLYLDKKIEESFQEFTGWFRSFLAKLSTRHVLFEIAAKQLDRDMSEATIFVNQRIPGYEVLSRSQGGGVKFDLQILKFRQFSKDDPEVSLLINYWDQIISGESLPKTAQNIFLKYFPYIMLQGILFPSPKSKELVEELFQKLAEEDIQQFTQDLQSHTSTIAQAVEKAFGKRSRPTIFNAYIYFTEAWFQEKGYFSADMFNALSPKTRHEHRKHFGSVSGFMKVLPKLLAAMAFTDGKKNTRILLSLILLALSSIFSPAYAVSVQYPYSFEMNPLNALVRIRDIFEGVEFIALVGTSVFLFYGLFRKITPYLNFKEKTEARVRSISETIIKIIKEGDEETALELYHYKIREIPKKYRFEVQRNIVNSLMEMWNLNPAYEVLKEMKPNTETEFHKLFDLCGELNAKFIEIGRDKKAEELDRTGEWIEDQLIDLEGQTPVRRWIDRLGEYFSSLSKESKTGLFLLALGFLLFAHPHAAISIPIVLGITTSLNKAKSTSLEFQEEIDKKLRLLPYLDGDKLDLTTQGFLGEVTPKMPKLEDAVRTQHLEDAARLEQAKSVLWIHGALAALKGEDPFGKDSENFLRTLFEGEFGVEILPPVDSNLLETLFHRHRDLTIQEAMEGTNSLRQMKIIRGSGKLALNSLWAGALSESFMDGFAHAVWASQGKFHVRQQSASLRSKVQVIDISSLFGIGEHMEQKAQFVRDTIAGIVKAGIGERKFVFVANRKRTDILFTLRFQLGDSLWNELMRTGNGQIRFLGNDKAEVGIKEDSKLRVDWVYNELKWWLNSKEFDILTDDIDRWDTNSSEKLFVGIFQILNSYEVRKMKSLETIKEEIRSLKIFQIHA